MFLILVAIVLVIIWLFTLETNQILDRDISSSIIKQDDFKRWSELPTVLKTIIFQYARPQFGNCVNIVSSPPQIFDDQRQWIFLEKFQNNDIQICSMTLKFLPMKTIFYFPHCATINLPWVIQWKDNFQQFGSLSFQLDSLPTRIITKEKSFIAGGDEQRAHMRWLGSVIVFELFDYSGLFYWTVPHDLINQLLAHNTFLTPRKMTGWIPDCETWMYRNSADGPYARYIVCSAQENVLVHVDTHKKIWRSLAFYYNNSTKTMDYSLETGDINPLLLDNHGSIQKFMFTLKHGKTGAGTLLLCLEYFDGSEKLVWIS